MDGWVDWHGWRVGGAGDHVGMMASRVGCCPTHVPTPTRPPLPFSARTLRASGSTPVAPAAVYEETCGRVGAIQGVRPVSPPTPNTVAGLPLAPGRGGTYGRAPRTNRSRQPLPAGSPSLVFPEGPAPDGAASSSRGAPGWVGCRCRWPPVLGVVIGVGLDAPHALVRSFPVARQGIHKQSRKKVRGEAGDPPPRLFAVKQASSR